MRVLADLDPIRLEQALLEALDRSHPADGYHRTLVIVPTARLADHVQRRLTETRPAWLGLGVKHFRGVALELLAQDGADPPRVFSPRLGRALLALELKSRPKLLWSRFVRRRPGALNGLAGSLSDLREAGISPAQLATLDGGPRDRALGQIYEAYEKRLGDLDRRGWVDEVGLVRRALAHTKGFAGSYEQIYLHGVYDLNGIQRDLIRALDESTEITVFLPADATAPVARFVRKVARDAFPEFEPLSAPGGKRDAGLCSLFDEEARPPADRDRFRFRHTQGAEAEVRSALASALKSVDEGCRPAEIALIARNLGPYASAIEEVFASQEIPWTSSLTCPLRRQPAVRDFLQLLRVVADDFPRRETAEMLGSPRIDWRSTLEGTAPPRVGVADSWSRKARIIGGLGEWTELLAGWAGRLREREGQSDEERERSVEQARFRAETARTIGRALTSLHDELTPTTARTWSSHARRFSALLDRLFYEPDDEAARESLSRLEELVNEMGQLDWLTPSSEKIHFQTAIRWIEQAVDEVEMTVRGSDDGGIQVLDLMQARGQTFRRIHLLGLNSGRFPAAPSGDPFLGDTLRARLREATGRPLPVKGWSTDEERLLLGIVLGSATERVEVSWQRADEAGRSRTPSLFLRELARVGRGAPDLSELLESADHIPSHPSHALEKLATDPGLIDRNEGLLLAALYDGTGMNLAGAPTEMQDGIRMLEATQSFRAVAPIYDGRIGDRLDASRPVSVSALERLGRCPLQYLFHDVLRVRELDQETHPLEIAAYELGIEIHDALENLYRRLQDDGLFDGADPDALADRAVELLDESRLLGDVEQRLSTRLPVLWNQVGQRWKDELVRFVKRDLIRFVGDGWRPESLEENRQVELDLGNGVVQTVVGRFDRVLVRNDDRLVGDYKTSGNIERRLKLLNMLRAETLQVPLYQKLAGGDSKVEILPVSPEFDSKEPEGFAGFKTDEQKAGFDETLRVLFRLRETGSFPFREGQHCSWCAYDLACRRNHPPTRDREKQLADGNDYAALPGKKLKEPLLPKRSGSSN